MTPLAIAAAAFLCAHPGIHDGDTIRCGDGTRVRIWGIDAHEAWTPEGPPSTRAMANIIHGQDLTCHHKGHSYDRVVAMCFLPDGRDVAGEMVRGNWAVDWPKFSHGFYASPGASLRVAPSGSPRTLTSGSENNHR